MSWAATLAEADAFIAEQVWTEHSKARAVAYLRWMANICASIEDAAVREMAVDFAKKWIGRLQS